MKSLTYDQWFYEKCPKILLPENFDKLVAKEIRDDDGQTLEEERIELKKIVAKEVKRNG
jgi:hypothetical protein